MTHLRDSLIFWSVIPWLVPQALWVRQRAPRLAGAQGAQEGRVGSGEALSFLAIGDSIIAGVGAESHQTSIVGQTAKALSARLNRAVHWQAIGLKGADTQIVLDQLLPQLPKQSADFILISVGVNDTTGLHSGFRWRYNLHRLLSLLRQHSPQAKIALTGLPPMGEFPLLPQPLRSVLGLRAKTLDHIAIEVLADNAALHVPVVMDADPLNFCGDGFHPSEHGYRQFGQTIADALTALQQ